MNKIFFTGAMIVLAVVIAGSTLFRIQSPSTPTSPTPLENNTPSQTFSTMTITYTNNGFSPRTITVSKDATITFKNESSRSFWPASDIHPSHTLYDGTSLQQHCANPTANTFDACSEIIPGSSWSFTFNKVGNWDYHDHLRAGQTGTVTVQ